jgi:iron complex transport system ATP-binding protein
MMVLNNLSIGYTIKQKTNTVFSNINASFAFGELVGLMGNNGIGKSTLLKTLTQQLKPITGNVTIHSKNINTLNTNEFANLVSIVTTEKIGGFNLTVNDVVALGRTPYINVFSKLNRIDEGIINEALQTLNIQHIKHKLLDELSDGQRQKVMIAKALAQQTPIIILDEPTAFLDYNSKTQLFEVLKSLCLTQKKLIIVSSHDIDLMKRHITISVDMNESGFIVS